MTKRYRFLISENEGLKFSKVSGDSNKIHIDNLTGYNSLFGTKICHGCLIIIKALKITNIIKVISKLKKYNIYINFLKNFTYNDEIQVRLKKNKSNIQILLFQNQNLAGKIDISEFLNLSLYKNKILIRKYKIKKTFKLKNRNNKIFLILENISKYVGIIYPGKNSLIKFININHNREIKSKENKILIFSKKIDKRLPFIDNKLFYRDYIVNFESLERPKINLNFKKLSPKTCKKIESIDKNILIIGASSGIGYDTLNMFSKNKKIKIFATYFNNKIKFKRKNIYKININVEKDLDNILKIIDKNSPINIYYFPTPKIFFDKRSNYLDKLYEKYFVKIPSKIVKNNKNLKNKFFYPSTTYKNNNSSYSKMKLIGEKKIKLNGKNKIQVNILKIDLVNTKQNLSVLNPIMSNFRDLLEKNYKYQKEFFLN